MDAQEARQRRRLIEDAARLSEVRVADIRAALTRYGIAHTAKQRKAQLVKLYRDKLVPLLEELDSAPESRLKNTAPQSPKVKRERSRSPTRTPSRNTVIGARPKRAPDTSVASPASSDAGSATDNVFQSRKRKSYPLREATLASSPSLKRRVTYKRTQDRTLSSDESRGTTAAEDTSTGTVVRHSQENRDETSPGTPPGTPKRPSQTSQSPEQISHRTPLSPLEAMPLAQGTPMGSPKDSPTGQTNRLATGECVGDISITPIEPDSLVLRSYSDASELDTPSPKRTNHPITLKGPSGDINTHKVTFNNPPPKTPDLSMDSHILTHLQSEIELEKSRVDETFERTFELYEHKERSKKVRSLATRFLTCFLLFVVTVKIGLALLHERILVGFCGYEIKQDWISLPFQSTIADSINQWHMTCVPCPPMGQCFPNSQLVCTADYKVSSPLLWSLLGVIPTYNECVVDSNKLRVIQNIINTTLNVLAVRNANVRCGQGHDSEVGLSWPQIVEYVSDNIALPSTDPLFDYYWAKAHAAILGKPNIVFTPEGLLRSHSTARMSWSCQIQTSLANIIFRLRYHLLALFTLAIIFLWVYLKVSKWQRKNEAVRDLTEKVFDKLQDHFQRHKAKHTDVPYLSKIQLRDYYLPQLKMGRKEGLEAWEKVASNVERNTNIRTSEVEIDGDIRRVWQWTLDLF